MEMSAMERLIEEPFKIWICHRPSTLVRQAVDELLSDPLVTRFRVGRYHVETINDAFVELLRHDGGWLLRNEPSDAREMYFDDASQAEQIFEKHVRSLGLSAVSVYRRVEEAVEA